MSSLIIPLDPPAQFGVFDERRDGRVRRQGRKPIFGRLAFTFGPFDEKPFFGMGRRTPIVAMGRSNSNSSETGGEIFVRAFAPCDLMPSIFGERHRQLFGRHGFSKEGYAGRIEVVAGPTGRRRRSEAEKARIAAESLTPDAIVADIARRYGRATRWQIYDWRRRFRRGLLAAPKKDVASPEFVPLTVDDDLQRTPHADIVEVAIGDILIRVGRDVGEAHLARIFRAAHAAS